MKRCSISLATREKQVKATMRHHSMPIRLATVQNKNRKKISVGKNAEKLEPMCTARGNVKR